jgi:hypothetical protein
MNALGLRMIDEKPRYGAGGARIAFVHPRTAGAFCWNSANVRSRITARSRNMPKGRKRDV